MSRHAIVPRPAADEQHAFLHLSRLVLILALLPAAIPVHTPPGLFGNFDAATGTGWFSQPAEDWSPSSFGNFVEPPAPRTSSFGSFARAPP